MSLADELLADLEDGDHDDEDVKPEVPMHQEALELEIANATAESQLTIEQLVKIWNSDELRGILKEIDKRMRTNKPPDHSGGGTIETHPEYGLMVDANNLSVEIENEITVIHKFIRDHYSKRFPELESLVVNPLEYAMTVKELGNELEQAKNNAMLNQFLTQATIMVVSVTASTTQGQPLSEAELSHIGRACSMAIELNECKQKIFDYVESRMAIIAPNLSVIVGSATAARLMGIAGGLTNLSNMPACNVMLLGSQKRTLSGFSQTSTLPHTGFIYYSPIVQDTPPDLRRRAARLIAAKCVLAARVDRSFGSPDATIGQNFKDEIVKKLDKLQEGPPVKAIKPLPQPIDPPRKRRGGKRVRRMKERYALTELRKQQNRMNFGAIEEDAYQEDLGLSLGLIKKGGIGGRVRAAQVDEKTKVRISKTLQKNLQKQQVYGGSSTVKSKKEVSGTASSVAFTPLQGLEIVNPQAAEKKPVAPNAKYFSSSTGFLKL